jgi:radical SAM protein with 4Fe4S-binding SPASM domain
MPVVVIKTINRCNSNCTYCYSNKGQLNKICSGIIKELFTRFYEYFEDFPDARIEIQWHGGEPLLLGEKFYNKVIQLQSSILGRYQENIVHTMQSNLTLLNKSLLSVLSDLKIATIGTSIEAVPGIRGIGRWVDSEAYMQKLLQGISFLESGNIMWGINYVVTSRSVDIPEKILYYLSNLILQGQIVFNPVNVRTAAARQLKITAQQYVSFLEHIYLLKNKNLNMICSIEPVNSMDNAALQIIKGIPLTEQSYETPLVVDGEGNFSFYKFPGTPIGNVQHGSFHNLLIKNERINYSIAAREKKKRKCLKCTLCPVCQANTVNDSFSQNDDYLNPEWCNARREFVLDFLINQKVA